MESTMNRKVDACALTIRNDMLKLTNVVHMQREEKRKKITEIARQENIPVIHCSDELVVQPPTSTLDTSNLEVLLRNNQVYLDNIELGKQIAAIIDKVCQGRISNNTSKGSC